MAKYKAAGRNKPKATTSSARTAIPCLVLIVLAIAVLCLLFYFSLQSSAQ
jgi:hypothetical protein